MILLKNAYFSFKRAVIITQRAVLQKKYFTKLMKNTIIKNNEKIQEFNEIRIYSIKQRIFKFLKIMPKIAHFQNFIKKKKKSIYFQTLFFNYEEEKAKNDHLSNLKRKWENKIDEKWVNALFH